MPVLPSSLQKIVNLQNPLARKILDRSRPLDRKLIQAVLAQSTLNMYERTPPPAYNERGEYQMDFDLLSLMFYLYRRGAAIVLPVYQHRLPKRFREDEWRVGERRFGRIISLISNRKFFSFSVRILDVTIIKRYESGYEKPGQPRTYMLVDYDGKWRSGWSEIAVRWTSPELEFLKRHQLMKDDETVEFQYYIHPARWQSIFGAPYLLTKMLENRLRDEIRFYRNEMARLRERGIFIPHQQIVLTWIYEGKASEFEFLPEEEIRQYRSKTPEAAKEKKTREKEGKVEVESLEMKLSAPLYKDYQPVTTSKSGYASAYIRQRMLAYHWLPQVQFINRANEAAYFHYGLGKIASWMRGFEWEKEWKESPRKRICWNRIELADKWYLCWRLFKGVRPAMQK